MSLFNVVKCTDVAVPSCLLGLTFFMPIYLLSREEFSWGQHSSLTANLKYKTFVACIAYLGLHCNVCFRRKSCLSGLLR